MSDVYQDLFGEGSFVGKGIYDVDAFEQCCGDFPENAILSHDLLESAYARSALLSDVELYEEYPVALPDRRQPAASLDARRLADRLVAAAVGPGARRHAGQEPDHRAVVVEDLRQPPPQPGAGGDAGAAADLLAAGWAAAGGDARPLFVLAVVGAVPLLAVLADLVRKPADLPLLTHLRVTADALGKQSAQFLFTLIFLPYEAYISLDAIVRTLVRVLWTKTKTAGVEDLQRRRPRRPHRSAWLLPVHVDRAGALPSRRSCS